jgi:hypothetical protein
MWDNRCMTYRAVRDYCEQERTFNRVMLRGEVST